MNHILLQVSDSRHDELLEAVTQKSLSAKLLKVSVNEAKELKLKSSDTPCNPFVVLYIQSTPSNQFSTSVQLNTLNPVWDENVSMYVYLLCSFFEAKYLQ